MHFPRLFIAFFLCCFLLQGVTTAQKKKLISVEDIYERGTFTVKNVPGFNAMKNGIHYSKIEHKPAGNIQISIFDIESGKKQKDIYSGKGNDISNYSFNDQETMLLLYEDPEPIYRRSILYKVWVYDITTKEKYLLDSAKVLHATFSPLTKKIAYVKDNNLFVHDIGTRTTLQVTTDGKKNYIINGNCDWVYEEEFEFTKAFEWSPDGKYISYYRFDESRVKEYTIPFYVTTSSYPENYVYKYPKAGEDNSIVSIHIFNTQSGNVVKVNLGDETDQYIPRIKWSKDSEKLCVYRLNRLQNRLELLLSNAGNGNSEIIYEEENPSYIEINDNLHFLSDGSSIIFTSEMSGYNHLYLWNWKNKELQQLSSGNWDVKTLYGIEEELNLVYFSAHKESPLSSKLYSINWKNKDLICLTPEEGNHLISPCYGFKFFLDKQSSLNQPPVYSLIDRNGKKIRVLEDNADLNRKMKEYDFGEVKFLTFANKNDISLNAWMITPPSFNPTQKYPVLMYQYSGPGSQQVIDEFPLGNYFWHQMLAQKGYIVFCVDGTGTGNRGQDFKKATYLQLGKLESEDQAAAAEYLARQPFVDAKRIGIWGWSYGGFISSTCIFKYNDLFKTAIAVAPVTNWRYYDNIYTERYMRKPQDNPQGYDDNAPEKMAKKLKGNYLLIHGTADDNVHFQNAASLTNELIKENKQFRSEYYPNKNHGIYGGKTRVQLYQRMTEFILEKL